MTLRMIGYYTGNPRLDIMKSGLTLVKRDFLEPATLDLSGKQDRKARTNHEHLARYCVHYLPTPGGIGSWLRLDYNRHDIDFDRMGPGSDRCFNRQQSEISSLNQLSDSEMTIRLRPVVFA